MDLLALNGIVSPDMPPILVVEDEEDIRELLVTAFEQKNFNVVAVGDGKEAQRLIKAQKFSALVLDVVVPGANGIEIATMARVSQTNSDTPIFLESGSVDLEIVKMAKSLKVAHILVKPFKYTELADRIIAAINEANTDSEGEEAPAINYAEVNSQKNLRKIKIQQKAAKKPSIKETLAKINVDIKIEG